MFPSEDVILMVPLSVLLRVAPLRSTPFCEVRLMFPDSVKMLPCKLKLEASIETWPVPVAVIEDPTGIQICPVFAVTVKDVSL
jgi:hypothetical protein